MTDSADTRYHRAAARMRRLRHQAGEVRTRARLVKSALRGAPGSGAHGGRSTPPGAPARFARELGPSRLGQEEGGATNTLFERLAPEDVSEIEQRITASPEHRAVFAPVTDPITRRALILAFGIDLEVPGVAGKTGLIRAYPPDDVHSMGRGPLSAAGGLYEADLITDALGSAGISIEAVTRALDFGCSSGRVLRVLAAAFPDVEWLGCDPNGPAINWANATLPAGRFFTNGDEPPLELEAGSLDLAYAISIWSHFEPELGLRWFDEMARLVRPGGHLVLTTHGLGSVGYYAVRSVRSVQQSDEIIGDLYRRGTWYAPEFGEKGDWGVVNPAWGTAFLSPEWLLDKLTPRWRVLEFSVARNQENQDVYVLQRV